MRLAWLVAAITLVALPAQAWPVHGSAAPPGPQVATFGAKTLAGYGGLVPNGLSGALTIVSEKNGSGSNSTDFVVNTDYDGVSGQIVPTGTYGNAGPTYNGPYTLSVSGTGGTKSLTINIVANESTVKSQYGFATHGDSVGTTHQLGVVTQSASSSVIALGDTVVLRNGSGSTGITPALNPVACATAGGTGLTCGAYFVQPPSGGYASSTGGTYTCQAGPNLGNPCIQITSDTQGAVTSPDGFLAGGGAQLGELFINNQSQATAYADPIELTYVSFVRNYSYTNGLQPTVQQLDGGASADASDAYGWSCLHCEFYNNEPPDIASIWFMSGVQPRGATIDHSYLHGNYMLAVEVQTIRNGGVNLIDTTHATTITHNDFQGLQNDALDIVAGASNVNIEYNFYNNLASLTQNPSPGDYFIVSGPVTTQVYTFVSSYTNTQGSIPLSTTPVISLINAACTVNGGGTITLQGYGSPQGSTYTCVSGVNYPAVETPDVNVSVTLFNDTAPNTVLTVTALAVGTAGNSIALWNGNSTYAVCSSAGAKSFTNCQTNLTSGNASSTSGGINAMSGGTVSTAASGKFTFSSTHSDTSQWDDTVYIATTAAGSISSNVFTDATSTKWGIGQYLVGPNITTTTRIASGVVAGSCSAGCAVTGQANAASASVSGTPAPLRPGGFDSYNIAVRNNSLPNRAEAQFLFLQQSLCCVTNVIANNNISNLIDSNSIYLQQANNPTANYNTLLNDVEANAWDPGCTPWPCTVTEPSFDIIANPIWETGINRADLVPIAGYGGGGGTFINNLSNYYAGQLQTTTAQGAPWNLSSGTLTQTNNQNVGSNYGVGIWAYGSTLFPAQACNNNQAGYPCDGTTVFASYHLMMPNLPSGYQTSLTNRATAIAAFTPTPGYTFTASTTSGSGCLHIVSGTPPVQYTPVNGPGFSAGSIVIATSGGTCGSDETVNINATSTQTAQTFATLATNPDGSINGALTYADSSGAACWNDGRTNFNQSQTCAAQGLTPATQDVPTSGQLDFSKSTNSGLIPTIGGF